MRPGLAIFLGTHDVREIETTVATLRACGAVTGLVLIESQDGRRQRVERVVEACVALRVADVTPILYSFPDVTGDLDASIAHYHACRAETKATGQWDVEPRGAAHWSQGRLDRLLAADPEASVTTTRAELARGLDLRGHTLWLQAEAQTSVDHIPASLAKWPDAIIVTGAFGEPDDKRTLEEFQYDLDRCQAQARRTGTHGVWSVHALTQRPDLCDALRAWALATW